ncbi:MAG TPA: DinB family protein [Pyrinomonadaceae bacterium]|nr:DinB family protein [Pyrinomonadaceae bacterium]
MPSEVERIQNQLQRAFAGEAWHGPSLLELLADVDAATAAARPIAGAHNIWELVLHIAAWDKAVAGRLGGSRVIVSDEENFPVVDDTSEASWQKAIETLKQNHRELMEAMGRVEEDRLDKPAVEGMSSVYGHMHGAIQHDLYHAGQIAVLKKA